jgi:ketosteroid isomerase-like protein
MSQDNTALARRAVDAVNRKDLDALLALMDEAVESASRIVTVEGGLHGHDGVRRWWEGWFGAFPDYTLEVLNSREIRDVVVLALRAATHGPGSDLPLEERIWHTSGWRGDKCVWWRVFNSVAEAVQAAELR